MTFLLLRTGFFLKILCAVIITVHFFPNNVFTQTTPKVTISGQVTDEETGQPIPIVNVYLSGTALGDMADENGNYIIERVPYGNYELVASMMGYEIQKIDIAIYTAELRTFHFKLNSKVLSGEEIKVTIEEPKEWKKNLKIFEKIFFGAKDFSKKCKFLNPEYINFEYDEVSKIFRAVTEEPIRFENKALGYEVTFHLEKFIIKLYDNSKKEAEKAKYRTPKKTCYIQFYKELIPKNNGEKKKWEKNRRTAYNGSQRHFLKSLYTDRLNKEGFEIYGSTQVTQMDDFKNLYRIKPATLLKKSKNDFQRILSFPDLLMVLYKKEKNDILYELNLNSINQQYNRLSFQKYSSRLEQRRARQERYIEKITRYQTSWLSTKNGNDTIINENGFIINENAALSLVSGYWLWNSPTEWLPYDYQPDKK